MTQPTRRKSRVLQIITVLGTGGATKVVLDIASHFHQHPDYEVEIVTGPIVDGRVDMRPIACQQGIKIHTVPTLVNHISPLINAKALNDIRRIIVQGRFDIVHTHSSVAGIVGRAAAKMARTPTVVHHVHGWGLQEDMTRAVRLLYLGLERISARYTDRMVVVSKPDLDKGLSYRIAQKEKFRLIYNGIELERFRQSYNEQEVRAELGVAPHTKLIGMIGRLDRQKNPCDFIRAAALVAAHDKHVQFLFVGDGPLRTKCEDLIRELNLEDKFFLLGFRDDVAKILSILTFTAMSSLWEGLPIAFLEAMGAGKPIIANNVDGARDVVVNGETGFLIVPHQPAQMAERMLYLLTHEKLCDEIGRLAQQRSNYFSVERMVQQIESLYQESASSKNFSTSRSISIP